MQCRSCDSELTPGARFCAACAAPVPSAPDPGDPLRTALEDALGFQYRVERLLGRGGMGAVYLATELALDREVAIKVLPPDRGGTDEGRARFRREARTAARLSHPHIVPLLTFGEVKGLTYCVMGYVRGESLGARMRREGRLGSGVAARILADVADGLDYAHRQGVVHRDVKPDNVLLDEETGRALLTDFGIAWARGGEALTSTGMVVGTPRYMSPEQAAASSDVDGRSDLYSLGLVGYEMVSGEAPFEGRTPAEQILQRLTRVPAPLTSRVPETPPWLATAVGRCLERDPAARWPDGRAVAEQLRSGGTELEELPAALENLGVYAQLAGLAGAYGIGLAVWDLATGAMERWFFVQGRFDPEPVMLALAIVPPLLALLCLNTRRKGYPWAEVFAALVRQPRWWVGPYPRRARRAGDVWDRLPHHLRIARTVIMALPFLAWWLAVCGAIDTTGLELYQRRGYWTGITQVLDRQGGQHMVAPLIAYLLALPTSLWVSLRRLQRGPLAGVDRGDVWPVFLRSTANRRFWRKPVYAGLLLPRVESTSAERTGTSGPAPVSPSDVTTPTQPWPGRGAPPSRRDSS
jgi:predicted Ser/Thr protein kinase